MKRNKGFLGNLFDFKPKGKPYYPKKGEKFVFNKGQYLVDVKVGKGWYGIFNPTKVPLSMATKVRKPAKKLGTFYMVWEKQFWNPKLRKNK